MRFALIFLCFHIFNPSFGQERATISKNREYKEVQKQAAEKAIKELKKGVLFVRLDFREREVAYYEEFDNIREAKRIIDYQQTVNTEIIKSFNRKFNFCPVYFFSMKDSRQMVNGNIDSVLFYSSECLPDATIRPAISNYFFGEFGKVEQDTMYYSNAPIPNTSNSKNPSGKTYYGDQKNEISALIIRDETFYQLKDPFPYYSMYSPKGAIKRRYVMPIEKMNRKLNLYFEKTKE